MYDGKERFDPIIYDNGLHFTHSMMRNAGGSFWEMHTNQLKITLFLYKNGFYLDHYIVFTRKHLTYI